MATVMTAVQFTASCLALGLGLFLAAGAARDLYRSRLLPVVGARTMAALSGMLLAAAGVYGARLTVPL